MLALLLKMATIKARPTATSAAATVMMKKTKICPFMAAYWREKATKARLAAFSISSMDMKTTMALRRISTPSAPMMNKIADRTT